MVWIFQTEYVIGFHLRDPRRCGPANQHVGFPQLALLALGELFFGLALYLLDCAKRPGARLILPQW